jgi:mRNA-degrading endonuclease RelE of RelBE toxin-antitoxin system
MADYSVTFARSARKELERLPSSMGQRILDHIGSNTIESDYILIVAVMHCSREPGYWKHRVTRLR